MEGIKHVKIWYKRVCKKVQKFLSRKTGKIDEYFFTFCALRNIWIYLLVFIWSFLDCDFIHFEILYILCILDCFIYLDGLVLYLFGLVLGNLMEFCRTFSFSYVFEEWDVKYLS